MLLPPKDLTILLFFLALSLYLTLPTASSCLLYGAVTVFFVVPIERSTALFLFCELCFLACVVYVFYTSSGAGYVVPLLGTAIGFYSDQSDG